MSSHTIPVCETASTPFVGIGHQSKKIQNCPVFPHPPMIAFKQPNSLRTLLVRAEISKPNTIMGKSHSCGDKRLKCFRHMQHSSSYNSKVTENSTTYFVLLIARVQMLFTFFSVPSVASNTLASLRSPSTNA